MGNIFQKQQQNETPEQRQERLQRKYGVLMPPNFVTGEIMSISSQAAVRASQSNSPSILRYLWSTNPGNRLVQEYMQPGVSMKIPMANSSGNGHGGGGGGNIVVDLKSFQPNTISSSPSTSSSSPNNDNTDRSTLWAGHAISPYMNLEVLVPTNGQPSMQVSASGSNFGITGRLTNNGKGWIEGKYKARLNNTHGGGGSSPADSSTGGEFIISSWTSLDSLQEAASMMATAAAAAAAATTTTTYTKSTVFKHFSHRSTTNPPIILHLQAGIDYQEAILAAQTEIPVAKDGFIDTTQKPIVETFLSVNLNYKSGNNIISNNVSNNPSSDKVLPPPTPTPPLWLTMKHKPYSHWILNLSQLLTFDRMVMNPFEERAPKIRQTLGWVVQVEKDISPTADADSYASSTSSWLTGATFQWNRAIATKVILTNGHTLTYGLIVKNWHQPRVTLSLLNSFDFPSAKHSIVGFGLEVETAPVQWSGNNNSTEDASVEYSEQTNVPNVKAPPTKIQIPKHHQ